MFFFVCLFPGSTSGTERDASPRKFERLPGERFSLGQSSPQSHNAPRRSHDAHPAPAFHGHPDLNERRRDVSHVGGDI